MRKYLNTIPDFLPPPFCYSYEKETTPQKMFKINNKTN